MPDTAWRLHNAPPPSPWQRRRRRVHRWLHRGDVEVSIAVAIILSVVLILAEFALLDDAGTEGLQRALQVVGNVLTGAFIVELCLRWWVAPKKRRFFERYWIDIIAVIPWARPLRLLRVLRLFRAGIFINRRLRDHSGMLRGTWNELSAVATISATMIVLAGLTLATRAGHIDLQQLHMDGGLEGYLWYAVYTLVGGEPIGGNPSTPLGRAVTLLLMLGGMTVFGIFVGAVSASMSNVLRERMGDPDMALDELSDHIVVCGWNPGGPTMLQELFAQGRRPRPVVVVTEGPQRPGDLDVKGLPAGFVHYLAGDYTRVEVLEEAGIGAASAAILLTDSTIPRSDQDRDARTVLAALTIERIVPGIYCCAELINGQHRSLLEMARVEEVVIRDWYAGKLMGTLGRNRGVSTVLNDILSTSEGNAFHTMVVRGDLAGRTVGELHESLKRDHGCILVSWERDGPTGNGEGRETRVNPPREVVVQEGDRLVLIGASLPGRA